MASCFRRRRTPGNVQRIKFIFSGFLIALLGGCATPSPPGDVENISVSMYQSGKVEVGAPVRWGGTIAKINNLHDKTVLEIVSRPLLRSGRPRHNDQSDGRFLAELAEFLDPEIIKPGRDISVIGTVERLHNGKVGESDYRYPVLSVFKYQFWKKESEIDPGYGYPHYFYYERYWRDWPYRRRGYVHGNVIF